MNAISATDTALPTVSRRRMFAGAGAALMLACAAPAGAQGSTPDATLVRLVREWEIAFSRWEAALEEDQTGTLASPDCLKWKVRVLELQDRIQAQEASTPEGARALIRFLWVNNDSGDENWADVPHWALAKLMTWASAPA